MLGNNHQLMEPKGGNSANLQNFYQEVDFVELQKKTTYSVRRVKRNRRQIIMNVGYKSFNTQCKMLFIEM